MIYVAQKFSLVGIFSHNNIKYLNIRRSGAGLLRLRQVGNLDAILTRTADPALPALPVRHAGRQAAQAEHPVRVAVALRAAVHRRVRVAGELLRLNAAVKLVHDKGCGTVSRHCCATGRRSIPEGCAQGAVSRDR